MFYKVVYDGRAIDVLDHLTYLRYQPKYDRMVICGEDEAQAILSSDQERMWHVDGFYNAPAKYDTVSLLEIDEFEYRQLSLFNLQTVDEILEQYTELLLEEGII